MSGRQPRNDTMTSVSSADRHVVAVHHARARIVHGERGRDERSHHRQHRERQGAARHREYAGADRRQHQQAQALHRGQISEQRKSAVRREVRDTERRAAERERDDAALRVGRREE